MEHWAADAREGRRGPAEWFTGEVTMVPVVDAPEPARLRAVMVTFAASARTHWHTHPLGQAIHVISGRGRVQVAGGPVRVIGPGDTVWFAPGERHWHGADVTSGMVHLAMQEAEGGVAVTWGEPVTDSEFMGEGAPR
jgi:quercetin dioxygenase-like cupin family protein